MFVLDYSFDDSTTRSVKHILDAYARADKSIGRDLIPRVFVHFVCMQLVMWGGNDVTPNNLKVMNQVLFDLYKASELTGGVEKNLWFDNPSTTGGIVSVVHRLIPNRETVHINAGNGLNNPYLEDGTKVRLINLIDRLQDIPKHIAYAMPDQMWVMLSDYDSIVSFTVIDKPINS